MAVWEPEDGPDAIHVSLPFWEHRHRDGHEKRVCILCGAVLRSGNLSNRCTCHLTREYRPQCAPDAPERLLRAFQAQRGQVVHPLSEVFCMAVWDTADRQWLWRTVNCLRRAGHQIEAVTGRSGGYRYLRDVSDTPAASE